MLSLDELAAMIEAKERKSLNEERLLILAAVVRSEQALRAAECNRAPSVYPACESRYKQAVIVAEDFDRDLAQDVMVSLRVAMTLYPDLMKSMLYELLDLGEHAHNVQRLAELVADLEIELAAMRTNNGRNRTGTQTGPPESRQRTTSVE